MDKFILYLEVLATMAMKQLVFRSVGDYGYETVCFVFRSVGGYETSLFCI